MEIIELSINKIKPYEKNPRKNDEAVKYVANSIKEFGFKVPIVIDKNYVIVAGHTRYKASLELGLNEVPCLIADDLSDEQIKAFRLADNKVSEKAEWDFSLLDEELGDLLDLDFKMDDFGFDITIEEPMEAEEDDFDIVVPEEPKAKLGDVYQLGNHRLMCGDSTKIDDIEKLLNNERVDLLITDPPYNVDYTGKTKDALKIENDKMDNDNFHSFLYDVFTNAYSVLKDGASFYVWYASREVVNFQTSIEEAGLTVKQELIWNKNSMVMGRQDYQWKHEPCLYGWKDGEAHYFIDDRTQTTVIEDQEKDFNKMKKIELVNLLESIYSLKLSTTIIDEKRPSINDLHPTMKPIKLIAKLIKNSSRPGEKVLDLFGGSGSTLIACEQLNRICYMMEYDPKYADVIINRWETYTGKKAELIK